MQNNDVKNIKYCEELIAKNIAPVKEILYIVSIASTIDP